MTKAEGYEIVQNLINDFEQQEAYYTSKDFQETETRNRFIDPFFEALGWDFHQTNISKNEWDVHREFSQKDNSSTKKPDYAFRAKVGIKFKETFFVEAKAPWVKLTDKDPIYQAKRYAFSSHGKTPIVILTDFQELRVFNGLQKPIYDNPLQGLIANLDITYKDYLEKWDTIWDLFSKDAIYNGSISKLAATISRNTKTLDQEFLEDISNWRKILAKHIAIRNQDLKTNELNEAVQRIIDRLIFIRNLEDREIESEGTLFSYTNINQGVYQHLIPLFRNLDNDYNGLLFKEHFSEILIIDDKIIRDLIKQMCYPLSPYQFDEIEPEILGRIYERFLGSKIRLTDGHTAKVEEKPEVRHSGGVYYTPQYIVDHIVMDTIWEKIDGKDPDEIKNLTICDPACGSGSFLIGAYEFLLQYHKNWYANTNQTNKKKYKSDFYINSDNEIKLTLRKRSEILKNNLFGVDIDREATEVAIMSLYLKLLDDGFDKGQSELFMKGHILPDMTDNVKCGNSLISSNYYEEKDMELFNDEELRKVNAFDWNSKFPIIFNKNNGFDVIIGNPPYIFTREILTENEKHYFNSNYLFTQFKLNTYILFMEKSMKLINEHGTIGFIVPNNWLTLEYNSLMRKSIIERKAIEKIVLFNYQVFDQASVDTAICILTRRKSDTLKIWKKLSIEDEILITDTPIENYLSNHNYILSASNREDTAIEKINLNSIHLVNVALVKNGIQAYTVGEGTPVQTEKMKNDRVYHSKNQTDDTWIKYLDGVDVVRYYSTWQNKLFVKYGNNLSRPRKMELFIGERILIRQIPNKPPYCIHACYTIETCINDNNSMIVKSINQHYSNLFLLGIINSRAVSYWFEKTFAKHQRKVFPQFKVKELEVFPIPIDKIDMNEEKNKMIKTVQMIINENIALQLCKTQSDIDMHNSKIELLNRQVDKIVYTLFGLDADDIAIIEQ